MPRDKEGHGIFWTTKVRNSPPTRTAPRPRKRPSPVTCRHNLRSKRNPIRRLDFVYRTDFRSATEQPQAFSSFGFSGFSSASTMASTMAGPGEFSAA
jgi:hypothetical protein